ncbi:MAG: putative bifunctional diguanylate cyclase/phosphodiesterase [Granulosicoccus sp.]
MYGHDQTALTHTSFMVSIFDAQYQLVYANPAAYESLPANCVNLGELLANTNDLELLRNNLGENGRCDVELEVNTRAGLQWHSLNITQSSDPVTSEIMYVVSSINTTEQRLAQQAAYQLAYNDSLTGLPNRAALYRLLQNLMHDDDVENTKRFALFFLDLDRFKIINDSLGHSAGDQLLIRMAQILRKSIGTKGSVYRLGGDEFVMVITRDTRFEDLKSVAESVRFASAAPIVISDQKLRVLASIGICRFPNDGTSVEELLDNADSAMYRAKSDQSGYCFFNKQQFASLNAKVKDRLCLENDLAAASLETEFELHFQPKIACSTLSISGVEALLRWHHPQRGDIPPETFIRIAEDTGQIIDLGNWVLLAAMRQQKAWQDMGLQIPVSLNISARQFSANDLLADVSNALALTRCNPRMIELEITESLLIGEPDAVFSTLQQLSAIGIRLALDDFGTGYSNLAYLQQYPLDCLKIDKIFLADQKRSMLVATILEMGKALGLELVAEGVETVAQAKWLASSQCDHMQGFYFSKPLPVKEATDYIIANSITNDTRSLLSNTKSPDKAA